MASDYDAIILGGGAAGLFCAFQAGQRGQKVLVIEHANKVGKKILMSGGGRCNFTNLSVKPENFLSANPHFCRSALARYKPEAFIALVEQHGIAYHEKELGQLFCDDSSKQIVQLLLDECAKGNVQISTDCEVRTVQQSEGGFELQTTLGVQRARKLVVATGGLSIPSLGGSGFGYELARQFGHALLPTRASLVPLTLSGRPLEELQDLSGLSLPIEASANGASFRNHMLVTHRGLSGPALLQISNYWQPGEPLQLDLYPQGDALEWLLERKQEQPAAELKTVLGALWPQRFAQRFCELHALSKPMRHYNQGELKTIAHKLQHWPVLPNGTEGYRTAEVTLGGVDTREVSSSTFESQREPGLHFIGEVLDVTGWLGGYNFHWAWASAHACAQAL